MTKGRYGIHGGQYIPETLMNAVIELEKAYNYYKNDKEFNDELNTLLNEYAGRPSLLYYAARMTEDLGGAKIYLKREDLNHTGAHKINNVLGQILLAKRMGKSKPSVTVAIQTLEQKGYLTKQEHGILELTEKGRDLAKRVYERHCFFHGYFTHIGLSEEEADENACAIEHVLSENCYRKLKEKLGEV